MPSYDYTISSFTLPNGDVVEIKDEVARAAQESGMHFLGVTTSDISDGSTTATITIGGQSVTAVAGDIVTKGNKELLFDGSVWHEMGDLSTLGALAYKATASGSYTPDGECSGADVDLTTVTKYVANSATGGGSVSAGTASAFSASVSNEVLTFTWSAGTPTSVTLPSFSEQTIATGVDSVTQPTFSGEADTVTVA